jgi:long-chain acyl-CoA synthetase
MGLGKLLEERARSEKDRVFLHFEDRQATYAGLFQRVRSLAAGLLEQGFKPGDRAAINLPNCPEFIESFLAILYAGGVAVPLNPQWKAGEIEPVLGNAGARFMVLSAAAREEMSKLNRQSLPVEQFICLGDSSHADCFSYESLFINKQPRPQESGDDQLAVLAHTAGTTGKPKAVMLTHKNFMTNLSRTSQVLKLNEKDVFLGMLPLYHVMGLTFAMMPLFFGGAIVLAPDFVPSTTMKAAASHKITGFVAVPTVYAIINQFPGHPMAKISEFRFAISGGAPLPLEVREQFEKRFHIRLLDAYGMSEATCVVTLNPPEGPDKPGSVGVPLPGIKMKAANDEGQELPNGQVGEFWISGDSVMSGYLGDPGETETVLKDGWLHTGDLGYRDEDGYFYIKNRKTDLIIRGGENIYPREVEEVLLRHPGVAEAAVIGIDDWVWGEEVMAFVVPKKDVELSVPELGEFLHKQIADYKCPRIWKILSEMPRTGTGEVSKKKLSEKYATKY